MHHRKSLTFAAVLLFLYSGLSAQKSDVIINDYAVNFPNERIYAHFDNSLYAPGDTVWYKIYAMAGFLPTAFSKNVYIDWSDVNGKVLAHQMLPLENATAAAQFAIPENYAGNALFVTAYTKWMLNDDSAFLFRRQLSVATGTPPKPEERQAIRTSLVFFPEGGYGVSGVSSRIAFKATDQWGNPVAVRGTIEDEQQKVTESFVTTHNGMGQFEMTPLPGVKYTATWSGNDGRVQRTVLPAFRQEGIVLKVDNGRDSKKITITTAQDKQRLYEGYHLLVTMQQRVVYLATLQFKDGNSFIETNIPVSEFPSGIMVVSLLTANWQPVAERISFVYDDHSVLRPELKSIRKQLDARGLNELELLYKDTFAASLSVSVTDAGMTDTTATDNNIISSLLLSEELKGQVHDPVYYFSDTTAEVAKNMDLVMLTNGWRNYNWQKIVQRKKLVFEYAPDTTYMVFSGQIRNVPVNAMRNGNGLISFTFKDAKPVERRDLLFKKDGLFADSSLIIFDTVSINYRFPTDKSGSATSDILFFREKLPVPSFIMSWRPHPTGQIKLPWIREQRNDGPGRQLTLLPNVVVKTRQAPQLSPIDQLEEKYAGDLAKNAQGYKLNPESDPGIFGYTDILQYLPGRVPGLELANGELYFSRYNKISGQPGPPAFFVNDILTDKDGIKVINPRQIAFVKAIPGYYVAAPNGGTGSILIYTKKDYEDSGIKRAGFQIEGYTLAREFYQPDYSKDAGMAPDNRRTLYWNPNLTRDPASDAYKFSFYNNDQSRRLKVIIEGVNTDGKLIRVEKTIE